MSPFDDDIIMTRLFDKLDSLEAKIEDKANKIEVKVDDLCTRVTKIEVVNATVAEIAKEKADKKEKTFYVVMALVGGIVSIVEVVRSGIIG